jgi:hypothetical protein
MPAIAVRAFVELGLNPTLHECRLLAVKIADEIAV